MDSFSYPSVCYDALNPDGTVLCVAPQIPVQEFKAFGAQMVQKVPWSSDQLVDSQESCCCCCSFWNKGQRERSVKGLWKRLSWMIVGLQGWKPLFSRVMLRSSDRKWCLDVWPKQRSSSVPFFTNKCKIEVRGTVILMLLWQKCRLFFFFFFFWTFVATREGWLERSLKVCYRAVGMGSSEWSCPRVKGS